MSGRLPASHKLTVVGLISQTSLTDNNNDNNASSILDYDLFNGFFQSSHYQPHLAIETLFDYDVNDIKNENYTNNDIEAPSIWDSVVLMAVPKSKKSKGKKRMKHKQHVPDRIDWATCPKCKEPRRPHRICKKNLDVCGMRRDEWEEFKENPQNGDRVAQIVKRYTFGAWKSK